MSYLDLLDIWNFCLLVFFFGWICAQILYTKGRSRYVQVKLGIIIPQHPSMLAVWKSSVHQRLRCWVLFGCWTFRNSRIYQSCKQTFYPWLELRKPCFNFLGEHLVLFSDDLGGFPPPCTSQRVPTLWGESSTHPPLYPSSAWWGKMGELQVDTDDLTFSEKRDPQKKWFSNTKFVDFGVFFLEQGNVRQEATTTRLILSLEIFKKHFLSPKTIHNAIVV